MNKEIHSAHVFVVEDDPLYSELIVHILKSEGFGRISTYSKSKDCIAMLDVEIPDMFILDYKLEEGTGVEVLDHIMEMGMDVPVVFVSGQEEADLAVKMLQKGARDYIIKNDHASERLSQVVKAIFVKEETHGYKHPWVWVALLLTALLVAVYVLVS